MNRGCHMKEEAIAWRNCGGEWSIPAIAQVHPHYAHVDWGGEITLDANHSFKYWIESNKMLCHFTDTNLSNKPWLIYTFILSSGTQVTINSDTMLNHNFPKILNF